MLVEGLVRGRALEERRLVQLVLVDPAGVVVLHLVIVPGHDPWEGGVGRLQVAIDLVLRIPVAIVAEPEAPPAPFVVAHEIPARGALVDVIAEKDDGVQVLAGKVRVRRVVPLCVVLARREREAERLRRRAGRGRRPRPADRTLRSGRAEAIPVRPVRLEAGHLDVHRVGESG